jgi:hypothetical protein
MVAERLDDSPSLRTQMDGPIAPAYRRARIAAAGETGLDEDTFQRPALWLGWHHDAADPWPPDDRSA